MLCCVCSLELPSQDDSNEYPQHRVWKRTNRFRTPSLLLIWSSDVLSINF